MAPINDKELEDIIGKCSAWLPKAMEQVGCSAPGDVTSARCKKALRDTLAVLFAESYKFVLSQTEQMKQLKAELSSTKRQLIESQKLTIENQKWVISLQERVTWEKEALIKEKETKLDLKEVETAVKSSVESNVKEQFKLYSETVAENVMVCQPDGLSDPETLKKVVKSVVQEEDRSKNVIVFGLSEMKNENVEERVQEVFQEIGLKPALQASRVGRMIKEKSKRPVKVSLSSSCAVQQVLSQVRKLRQSASFSKVYVRPDRSEEARCQDRLLVQELLKKRESEPGKLHYIRAGTIHTKDKPAE